jgi:hypothetical protein
MRERHHLRKTLKIIYLFWAFDVLLLAVSITCAVITGNLLGWISCANPDPSMIRTGLSPDARTFMSWATLSSHNCNNAKGLIVFACFLGVCCLLQIGTETYLWSNLTKPGKRGMHHDDFNVPRSRGTGGRSRAASQRPAVAAYNERSSSSRTYGMPPTPPGYYR